MVEGFIGFLSKFGVWGLFFHSFIDAIFFPIPAFFLQVPLSIANPSDAIWLATAGYIACLLGTPIGYLIGKVLGNSILYKILKKKWVDSAIAMFEKNGETAVLIGAFTPIPFKVFTIVSGCLKFPLWSLMLYAALGRAAKFYAVGVLFHLYGRAAEGMVQNVSLYIFLIALPALLLFLFIKKKVANRRARMAELNVVKAEVAVEGMAQSAVEAATEHTVESSEEVTIEESEMTMEDETKRLAPDGTEALNS